jgi:hypothetical protein
VAAIETAGLSRVFNPFQETDVVLGQAMGAGAFPQQGDVPERRAAVDLINPGDVGHGPQRVTFRVLCVQPELVIAPPWNPLRSVQTDKVAARDRVENAPNLGLRMGLQVGGRRPAPRPQPIAAGITGAPLQGGYAAPADTSTRTVPTSEQRACGS